MSTDTTPRTCKPMSAVLAPCPMCREAEANIGVRLGDLSDDGSGNEFCCFECGNDFGRATINAILARWPAVIRWVESAPQFEGE